MFLFSLIACVATQEPQATVVASLPEAVTRHAAATVGDRLFLIGGETADGHSDVMRSAMWDGGDFVLWEEGVSVYGPLVDASLVANETTLRVHGGLLGAADDPWLSPLGMSLDLEAFDARTEEEAPRWIVGCGDRFKADHVALALGPVVYEFGGLEPFEAGAIDRVYRTTWRGDAPELQPPLSAPMEGGSGALVDRTIWLLDTETLHHTTIDADGNLDAWTLDGASPEAVQDAVLLVDADHLFVLGGRTVHGVLSDSIWMSSTADPTGWEFIDTLPTPLADAQLVKAGEDWLMLGGTDPQGLTDAVVHIPVDAYVSSVTKTGTAGSNR